MKSPAHIIVYNTDNNNLNKMWSQLGVDVAPYHLPRSALFINNNQTKQFKWSERGKDRVKEVDGTQQNFLFSLDSYISSGVKECWILAQMQLGEGKVPPWIGCQFIAGPNVIIWGFQYLAQGYHNGGLSVIELNTFDSPYRRLLPPE